MFFASALRYPYFKGKKISKIQTEMSHNETDLWILFSMLRLADQTMRLSTANICDGMTIVR